MSQQTTNYYMSLDYNPNNNEYQTEFIRELFKPKLIGKVDSRTINNLDRKLTK
jgi:hypothetical protein